MKNNNFKKVDAPIINADGNIFNLMGISSRALKENGYDEEAKEMMDRIQKSHSYDETLSIITEYINPVDINQYEDMRI